LATQPAESGERRQDVWANPITFDNRGQPNKPVNDQGYINGDGVLMYPGEEKLHPDQDRGIAGPINTVQLGNLRRGLQDHQYLTLCAPARAASLVNEELQAIVPRVFSDAKGAVGFAETGNEYERARYKLAQAIAFTHNSTKSMMKLAFSTLGCPHWELARVAQAAQFYGYQQLNTGRSVARIDLLKRPEFQPVQ